MVVGLAFTQYPTKPHPDDLSYIAHADYEYDARAAELDYLSGFGSPEHCPSKRQGDFNTVHLSTMGRPHIVDNHTLNGEPAPNAELATELPHQTREERYARFNRLARTDGKLRRLCPAWRELEEFAAEPVPDAAASGGTVGAGAAAAEEEEEDSESEAEAILRAQRAARATAAEVLEEESEDEGEGEARLHDLNGEETEDYAATSKLASKRRRLFGEDKEQEQAYWDAVYKYEEQQIEEHNMCHNPLY